MTVSHTGCSSFNVIVFVVSSIYAIVIFAQARRPRGREVAREPRRRSSTTRISKAAASSACRAGRCSSRRSSRSRCRSTGCGSPPGRTRRRSTSTTNSVARGATLFANPGMPDYNAASRRCSARTATAKRAQGGVKRRRSVSTVDARCTWKAPPLNTELLRFSQDESHADHHVRPARHPDAGAGACRRRPEERPGISDLVAYIKSIQLTPTQRRRRRRQNLAIATGKSEHGVPRVRDVPAIEVATAKKNLATRASRISRRPRGPQSLKLQHEARRSLDAACESIKKQVDAERLEHRRSHRRSRAARISTRNRR